MKKNILALSVLAISTATVLAGCGSGASKEASAGGTTTKKSDLAMTVGSKDNTENHLIGEMYAEIFEDMGMKVTRKLSLGGTAPTFEALKKGDLDIYPEYTGTGLTVMLKQPVEKDQKKVEQTLSEGFKQWNLEWLESAPENATYGFATKKETADKYKLESISDLAKHSSELTLSYPQEFDVRDDSLPGLQKAFKDKGGFKFKKQFQIDYSLRYNPLKEGQSDVTVSVGTDGQISGMGLKLLKDDISFFPIYHVAPLVRKEKLDKEPAIKERLNKLSKLLTDEAVQKMNWQVDGPDKKEIEAVAKAFLKENKLIK
ncbi:glycine/betaine ABC transporter substrate-binding protein [Paenibacillus alginolyticus]|uniref:ABC transporter substrate-binding protein n=1 Tax=Paenibacillus alginolyticus TaxID=59839 RepID=UPI00040D457C|nr:glycine betaine ABC transporter substrate-binding protein [Paenibacillus alginolyticus]MCY9670440.1 glycine/betaine ABC transporter substrate-binding protein [Paenibacillus alginolyticus]